MIDCVPAIAPSKADHTTHHRLAQPRIAGQRLVVTSIAVLGVEPVIQHAWEAAEAALAVRAGLAKPLAASVVGAAEPPRGVSDRLRLDVRLWMSSCSTCRAPPRSSLLGHGAAAYFLGCRWRWSTLRKGQTERGGAGGGMFSPTATTPTARGRAHAGAAACCSFAWPRPRTPYERRDVAVAVVWVPKVGRLTF